jgi:outer membrane protein TolC
MHALTVVVGLVVTQPSSGAAAPAELLSLAEAQRLALTNNLDLRIAHERLGRAQVLSKKAWALFLPVLSASAQQVRNNTAVELDFIQAFQPLADSFGVDLPPSEPAVIQREYQKSASLNATWPLFNGRAVPLLFNAYDNVEVAELTYKQTQEAMRHATALSYFNVVNAHRQVEIRERSLANKREHLKLERARLAAGDATPLTALRSEVEVATDEQALIQAENAARTATRALATLIDWLEDDGSVRPFSVTRPEPPAPPGDGLLDRAYSQRLDLKTRTLELDIAERAKTETWMKFAPTLSGTGTYRWSEAAGFSGENTTWQVGLVLSWTFFEGGLTFWELDERQHDINAAALTIEKTRRDIARDVAEARLNLESATASHRAAARRVELARRTATLVDAQYQVGAATQLDVLDAGRSLADAETAEALAQLSVDVARLGLEQTLIMAPGGVATSAATAVTLDAPAAVPEAAAPATGGF